MPDGWPERCQISHNNKAKMLVYPDKSVGAFKVTRLSLRLSGRICSASQETRRILSVHEKCTGMMASTKATKHYQEAKESKV